MGDYLRYKGDVIKIGTAGDNRYMTHDEALKFWLLDEGNELKGNLEYEEALWRFPYPLEDGACLDDIANRSMFYTITFTVPRELLFPEHDQICVCLQAEGTGGYGINRLIPCPLSKDDKVYGQNIPSPIVQIYGERYNKAGQGRTIFRCGYCGKPFSITPEELPKYQEAFINNWSYPRAAEESVEWAKKVAARFKTNS